MATFNIGDRVRVSPEGYHVFSPSVSHLYNKIWTVKRTNTRFHPDEECLISCGGISQYMLNKYMTNIKEDKTMNFVRKTIASITDRLNENTITCAYCGCIIDLDTAVEFEGSCYCPEHLDEVSFVCDDCGERKPIAESNYVNGADVCDDCLEENYAYCDQCERYVPREEINWCPDDDANVCDGCLDYERGYFRCANCGDIHSYDNSTRVYTNDDNSQLWCNRCVEYNANYCDECDRYFDCRQVSVTDGRCEYCVPEEQIACDIRYWSAPSGVRGYSYKPNPCFCMTEEQQAQYTPTDLVHFGFELEMEDHENYGENENDDADYLNEHLGFTYCKHDGSLDDGLELVSHPATLEYLMEKKEVFKEVFEEMTSRGYTSHNNGNCGLHVHMSLKPLIADNPYATDALIRIVDNLWDKLVRFSRRTDHQLDRWASRYSTKGIKFDDITKSVKRNCGRYMAVNMENTHTVEIRMFRGTLKVDTFFAVLQMVKRLADVCMECRDQDDADSITWEKLIDCEYAELKEYCDKRFAVHADDLDDIEAEPVREVVHTPEQLRHEADFTMSEIDMHLSNINIGDTIRVDSHRDSECYDAYIGMSGTVSEITESHVRCDGLFALNGRPLDIYPLHAHRTSPIRVGDYVRLVNDHSNRRGNIGFNTRLNVGEIGIVREIVGIAEIGVEFQRNFGGHDLHGTAHIGFGQWIGAEDLELI